MPLILPGNVASATAAADVVTNSCRFNQADGAFMSRTIGTPTDEDVWTFSVWLKVAGDAPSNLYGILSAGDYSDPYEMIQLTDGQLFVHTNDGGAADHGSTKYAGIIRDPSAWYSLVVSRNGTAGKIYVNGTDVTTTNSAFNNSSNTINKSGGTLRVGHSERERTGQSWNGYMAEAVFIDGQALTPTSFGEFNSDTPTVFQPIDVSGLTFGDNGFYLDFEDSGDLGDDESGNGNDFTETNLAATDQATDTPTNNFATLNPLMVPTANAPTFSEGNCKTTTNDSALHQGYSTIAVTKGKWYAECKRVSQNSGTADDGLRIGIGVSNHINMETNPVSADDTGHYIMIGNGTVYNGSNDLGDKAGDSLISDDEIVGIALDLDNDRISWASNNVWMTGSDAWSGSSPASYVTLTDPDNTDAGYFFISTDGSTARGYTTAWNFGGCSAFAISSAAADENGYGTFEFAPPSGYLALCTKNLATDG